MTTHSGILAWKITGAEYLGRATVLGVAQSDTTEHHHPLPHSLCYNFVSYHDNAFYWLFPFNVRTNPGSVQFSSVAQSCLILCNPMNHSMPGLPVHHQLAESTQTHVHWVGDAIQPSHPHHPLLLLPSIFPRIRVFSNESALHIRWPNYWSFSFNISLSNKHSGLISFRMDRLDLLAVQGTLKSLFQHHSSKHQFFCIQFSLQSNSYIHTWLLEKP